MVKQRARLIGDGDNMGATVVCVACAYDKALALERIEVTRDGGLFLFRLLSELALRKSARLLKLVEQVPLAVVFDRAFFGMGPRAAQKAFPCESVYTSAEGLMMQDAYSQAVEAYRSERLAKNPGFHEPEDHLAVEFVFMRILCEKTIAALERGDGEEAERLLARQRAFLQEHVLTWIDCFAADLRKSAEGGFYAHLATFTEAFAHADVAALDEVLG